MLVPVGIAYAVASGVPGIYGLYATIIPLLAYALFGPSRILVLGPDSSLAALILAVVAAIRRRPAARCRSGKHDGGGLGGPLHPVG
jgi:MFS superfamily sulfate permease-like transporter